MLNGGAAGQHFGCRRLSSLTDWMETKYFRKTKRGKKSSDRSGFLIQGSIYAASGIVSGLIGLLYRLPLTRIIGDEGNGYYSAAFNVYTIILLLSSYSLPLAVSKMISARIGTGRYRSAHRIWNASLVYATVTGACGFLLIFFGAGWFSEVLLHIPEAKHPLRALAPTVWIVSYLGVCRGYWQGHSTMVPTALSQVLEQAVNALVSVGAAWLLFRHAVSRNMAPNMAHALGATGGTIGTGMGAFFALLLFVFLFFVNRKIFKERRKNDVASETESYFELTRILVMTAVPVILSTAIYNAGGILDNAIFGRVMFCLGRQAETARDYGIYTAKYKLLLNVPIMVSNAVASALIPALSRAFAAGNDDEVRDGISNAVRFAMIVAIPSAAGLFVMADPMIPLLFGSGEKAILMMRIGCSTVVFYSLSTVTNAILQGSSHMKIPVRHALISLGIHVLILECFLRICKMGIFAVVLADMIFALSMCILNAFALKRHLHYEQEYRKTFVFPLLSAILMAVIAYILKSLISVCFDNRMAMGVFPVVAAIFSYAAFLIRFGAVSAEELKRFPGGSRLLRAVKKLKLIR